jgi:hypothetical protein
VLNVGVIIVGINVKCQKKFKKIDFLFVYIVILYCYMCMYYTKGINQDGYILCRYCNMMKDIHLCVFFYKKN